jgi:hypothetical protein
MALLPLTLSLSIPSTIANVSKCGDLTYNPAWCEFMRLLLNHNIPLTQLPDTCYLTNEGGTLCPIFASTPLSLCGHDCYTALQYTCNKLTLLPLPIYTGPITLTALNPSSSFHNLPVQAAGQRLVIGGTASTYCPSNLPNGTCPNFKTTVLYGSGTALATLVPGDQRLYIRPDGSVGFTQAHSAFVPAGSYQGAVGTAYSNAGFWGVNGTKWFACEGEGKGEGWFIYSGLFTKSWRGQECESVELKVDNLPSGEYFLSSVGDPC